MTKLEVLNESHERLTKLLTLRRFSAIDRAEIIRQLDRLLAALVASPVQPVKPFWDALITQPALPAPAPAPIPAPVATPEATQKTYPNQL